MSIKRVISKGNELRLPDIVDLDTGCGILAVETVKVSCKTTQIASRQPQFHPVASPSLASVPGADSLPGTKLEALNS